MLDRILLGMLREPGTGYDLKQRFDQSAAFFWAADQSQIYRTLKRMESEGWLCTTREPSSEGPERVVYHRTAAGRAALVEWLEGPPQLAALRLAYVAQLHYLGELGDLDRTVTWLQQLEVELAGRADALHGLVSDDQDLHGLHATLSLELGVATADARLAWCRKALRRAKQAQLARPSRRACEDSPDAPRNR